MIQKAARRYRWGKFQAWFCLFLAIVQLFLWRTFPLNIAVGIALLYVWRGLLHKYRYGFVLVYVMTGVATLAGLLGLAFASRWDQAGSVAIALCFWLIPAAFYYPKRYWEFGFEGNEPRGSDTKPEVRVVASTAQEPAQPVALDSENDSIRKVSYEEFREAVARYRVERMREE